MLTSTRDGLVEGSRLLLYFLLVLAAAAAGGIGPAICASLLATLAINWYFTPPLYTWTIDEFENVLDLVVFVVAGVGVSLLVAQVARRSAEALRAREEAGILARAAGSIAGQDDPLPSMIETLQTSLNLEGVAVLRYLTPGAADSPAAGARRASLWEVVTAAGDAPRTPEDASRNINLGGDAVLALRGAIDADEGQILGVFAAQLAAALERRALQEEAAQAQVIAEADALRTALLRAVSHDLRTPLASIKASVTSLLDGHVTWTKEVEKDFLSTIDEETDRLNGLVGNLLDMSRLEAGAVQPALRPVGLDDVVAAALASISGSRSVFDVDIPDDVPYVNADPVLLERAVANIAINAMNASHDGRRVRIEAAAANGDVVLKVIDSGPGVPAADWDSMFEPFQRRGDRGTGVGLGLAVARGLVEVMRGRIRPAESPGGGLTMIIQLPHGTG